MRHLFPKNQKCFNFVLLNLVNMQKHLLYLFGNLEV